MKLSEIMKLKGYEPDLSVLDAIVNNPNRTLVDTTENKRVYQTQMNNNTVFDIEGQAMLVGQLFQFKGQPAYRVGYVVVRPDIRRQGFATALYVSLITRQRLILVSDDHLTDGSLAVWNAISRVCSVKRLDVNTGDETPIDSIEQVMDNTTTTLLIARNESLIPEVIGTPIMEQPEKYTHPESHGRWD